MQIQFSLLFMLRALSRQGAVRVGDRGTSKLLLAGKGGWSAGQHKNTHGNQLNNHLKHRRSRSRGQKRAGKGRGCMQQKRDKQTFLRMVVPATGSCAATPLLPCRYLVDQDNPRLVPGALW